MEGQGKIVLQIGGKGFYARVHVTCIENVNRPSSVTIDPSAENDWHRSQGWTDAAIAGAELAFKLSSVSAQCTITRIHGMDCDTNPAVVALAALRAVWSAIGYEPEKTIADRVEALVPRAKQIGVTDLERELCAK